MNNPTLCIDVSKSSSYASAFITLDKPYSKPIYFEHTPEGMRFITKLLYELELKSGIKPDVVLEATGNYSKSITQYFQECGYNVIVLNPLQTSIQKRRNMRKIKTDPIDTFRIAQVYYMNNFMPNIPLNEVAAELRNLCRQWDGINTQYAESKVRFRRILDQVFPKLQNLFRDIACPTMLALISSFPTPKDILNADRKAIIDVLRISKHSFKWCEEKCDTLLTAARESLTYDAAQQSNTIALNGYIAILQTYQKVLVDIRTQIIKWSKLSHELSLLLSIPGVGEITAATILGEIGDIKRFDTVKKLAAFAGIDPTVYQSGNFKAKNNKISKRGSSYLRKALYQATIAGISKQKSGIRNIALYNYYSQKLTEGKAPKSAIVATCHKLLRIIFGILTTKTIFEPGH